MATKSPPSPRHPSSTPYSSPPSDSTPYPYPSTPSLSPDTVLEAAVPLSVITPATRSTPASDESRSSCTFLGTISGLLRRAKRSNPSSVEASSSNSSKKFKLTDDDDMSPLDIPTQKPTPTQGESIPLSNSDVPVTNAPSDIGLVSADDVDVRNEVVGSPNPGILSESSPDRDDLLPLALYRSKKTVHRTKATSKGKRVAPVTTTPTPSPSSDKAHDHSDPVEDKDDDFIPDAETWYDSSSKSEGLQCTPFKVSEAHSILFYSKANASRFATISHRTILPSYVLNVSDMSKYNLVHFFKERHLLSTLTYTTPYCPNLIFEFYSNLETSFRDERSVNYGKVYVRGHIFTITPKIINNYFHIPGSFPESHTRNMNEVAALISGQRVLTWPKKFAASSLTSLYTILHKLIISFWSPSLNTSTVTTDQALILYRLGTNQPVNIGDIMFKCLSNTLSHQAPSNSLPLASLIQGLLISQKLNLITTSDIYTTNLPTFKILNQVFTSTRVKDLPYVTPGHVPRSSLDSVSSDDLIMVPKTLWESILAILKVAQHALSPVQTTIAATVLSMEAHISSQKGGGTQTPFDSSPDGTPGSGPGCWYVGPSKLTTDHAVDSDDAGAASQHNE